MPRLSPEEWALLIVGLAGGKLRGATTLQKLGFLGVMEAGGSGLDYVPHKYGPYSEQLAKATTQLARRKLMRKDKNIDISLLGVVEVYEYELTEKGWEEYRKLEERLKREDPEFLEKMRRLVERWKDKPYHLLYYVYKNYPDLTVKSEIRDYVLHLGRILHS